MKNLMSNKGYGNKIIPKISFHTHKSLVLKSLTPASADQKMQSKVSSDTLLREV